MEKGLEETFLGKRAALLQALVNDFSEEVFNRGYNNEQWFLNWQDEINKTSVK